MAKKRETCWCRFVCYAGAVLLTVSWSAGATYTWSPGANGGVDSTWDTTAGNWNDAAAAWTTTDHTAQFSTAGGSATVSGTVSAYKISATTDFTINGGGTIVLNMGSAVNQSIILGAASGSTLKIGTQVEINTASNHRQASNVELMNGGSIIFNGGYPYLNNVLISGGVLTNASPSLDFYILGGGLAMTGGTVAAPNTRRFVLQGNVTINGAGASLRSQAGVGGATVPFSFNAANVQLNLREGELQAVYMSVVSATGTGFNFGYTNRSGAATLRPYAGRNLTLDASLNVNLQGTNAVISSTDGGGAARTVAVNAILAGSGGLTLTGTGTVNLTNNTYTGNTIIQSGTTVFQYPCLAAASDVHLDGGVMKLDFTGTNTINVLYTNGVALRGGLYSSNTLSRISGGGSLQAVGLPPKGTLISFF